VGLVIRECTDADLLSSMANTTVEEINRRLANENVAFVAYMQGQPAAFGWMARTRAHIGELDHSFILPLHHRYLWNFRTLAQFRGRGIYPALLHYMMQQEAQALQFWIIHAPENRASLKGITRAGFQYVGKLYSHSGRTVLETSTGTSAYRRHLEQMNMTLSSETAASCWNCSSPYLKKRMNACCCSPAGNVCEGNILGTMAA